MEYEILKYLDPSETVRAHCDPVVVEHHERCLLVELSDDLEQVVSAVSLIDHYGDDALQEALWVAEHVLAQFTLHISCISYLVAHACAPTDQSVGFKHL